MHPSRDLFWRNAFPWRAVLDQSRRTTRLRSRRTGDAMRGWPMEYQNWGRRSRGYERDRQRTIVSKKARYHFLPTGSVDQVGRKSEATLRIASLHFELSTLSGPATDQLELPSGAPDARHRQWG